MYRLSKFLYTVSYILIIVIIMTIIFFSNSYYANCVSFEFLECHV